MRGAIEAVRARVLRNRLVTETLQSLAFRWRHREGRPVVLVHQMARVGSITVYHALHSALPGIDLYHTHYLHPRTIAHFRQQFDEIHRVTGRAGLHREFLGARLLRQRIERGVTGRWRIVSLVRDPVARAASVFFRHFPYMFPALGPRFLEDPANVPALLDLFFEKSEYEHAFALDWFDREVREPLGIDVFATPFPFDAGFATLSGPFSDLLLLRLEDLDRVGPSALGSFFGTPPLRLTARNRSRDASYNGAFHQFLLAFRPPAEFLRRMYESRFARHFYREEERAAFRARWEHGSPARGDKGGPGVTAE